MLILASVGCGLVASAFAAPPDAAPDVDASSWRLVGETDGISVHTRPFEGSSFAEVRASAAVCATIPQLVVFVEDVHGFDKWIPDTEGARLLARPSPRQQIYYIRTSLPWPVKHRDMIYELTELTGAATGADVSVLMHGLPAYLPPVAGVVRMTSVTGRWDFAEASGTTRISLRMHIEPGGTVPALLASRRITGTPSKMLHNLKREFESACRGQ